MEGVGALGRGSLRGFAARAWFGSGTFHLHQRKIIDRARPCELGVLERGIVGRRGGELRERHDNKNEVPQGGGNQGTAGNVPLNPAVSKKSPPQKTLGENFPRQPPASARVLLEDAREEQTCWPVPRDRVPCRPGSKKFPSLP